MSTPYRQMPRKIEAREPFTGNSVHAEIEHDTGDYVIYSYATAMARVPADGSPPVINADSWSVTTSKIQGIIRWTLDGTTARLAREGRSAIHAYGLDLGTRLTPREVAEGREVVRKIAEQRDMRRRNARGIAMPQASTPVEPTYYGASSF